MLSLIARRGACAAGELGEPFEIAQPTASKHLRVLEEAGLVARQVDGRVHRFQLVTAPLDEAERWLSRHRAFWQNTLNRLGDVLVDLKGSRDGK